MYIFVWDFFILLYGYIDYIFVVGVMNFLIVIEGFMGIDDGW